MNEDFMRESWIGLGVDGASVMLGKKAGVAVKLKAKFPLLVSWHCFNHRLELSVHDAIKSCSEGNHFKMFIDSLYATYSASPKCLRELSQCAKELKVQIKRIGRVLDVRWVASSFRSVNAVWKTYSALHKHFCAKADDTCADGREKAKFAGFAKKLANPIFIKNLGLMYDALEELSDLSLALQKSDITLPVAQKLISRQIEVFVARKDNHSLHYKEACQAVADGTFQTVSVSASVGKEKEIKPGQFYQALSDSMAARLLPDSEKDLCNALAVLDPSTWPKDMISTEYGETEVRLLCDKFSLSFSDIKFSYRIYKDSKGMVKNQALLTLLNRVNTIPVSTAECERGFSKMNIVCTSLRSRLTVKHLSSLMLISLSGPPLRLWKPLSYVKSWLASDRRDATFMQCPKISIQNDYKKEHLSMWENM